MLETAFSEVLETAFRRSEVYTWGNISDKCIQIMAYVAGVIITRRRLQDVKEVFASLVQQTKKMRLEINNIKTKFIILSRKPYNGNEYVKLGSYNFEMVKHFQLNQPTRCSNFSRLLLV